MSTKRCRVAADKNHRFTVDLEYDPTGATVSCDECGETYDPRIHTESRVRTVPAWQPATPAERTWDCFLYLKLGGFLTEADGRKFRTKFAKKFPGVSIGMDGKEISHGDQAGPDRKHPAVQPGA